MVTFYSMQCLIKKKILGLFSISHLDQVYAGKSIPQEKTPHFFPLVITIIKSGKCSMFQGDFSQRWPQTSYSPSPSCLPPLKLIPSVYKVLQILLPIKSQFQSHVLYYGPSLFQFLVISWNFDLLLYLLTSPCHLAFILETLQNQLI